ncbi:MAG: type IV toxin-antitoxin system AbiEi family antitoxin domain-containing protein, partial [Anaerolineae bacterium]
MARKKNKEIEKTALEIFKANGGILRSSDAIKQGIHPRTLYTLRDTGLIEQIQKGLYCLPGLP